MGKFQKLLELFSVLSDEQLSDCSGWIYEDAARRDNKAQKCGSCGLEFKFICLCKELILQ